MLNHSRGQRKSMRNFLLLIICVAIVAQAFGFRISCNQRHSFWNANPLAANSPRRLSMVALENVKNFRDIQSASPRINILPSKLFRTGCMSKASDLDSSCILKDLNVKSLVDLRSPKELEDDEMLHTSTVYDGCMNYRYDKKMQEWKEDGVTLNGALAKDPSAQNNGRKRFFVSLMSESLIKRGVFFRFRKRIRVSCNHFRAIAWMDSAVIAAAALSPPPLHFRTHSSSKPLHGSRCPTFRGEQRRECVRYSSTVSTLEDCRC